MNKELIQQLIDETKSNQATLKAFMQVDGIRMDQQNEMIIRNQEAFVKQNQIIIKQFELSTSMMEKIDSVMNTVLKLHAMNGTNSQ